MRKIKIMTRLELKRQLINRIIEIDDVSLLEDMEATLEIKSNTKTIAFSENIQDGFEENPFKYKSGKVSEHNELEKEFDLWLEEEE